MMLPGQVLLLEEHLLPQLQAKVSKSQLPARHLWLLTCLLRLTTVYLGIACAQEAEKGASWPELEGNPCAF